MASYLIIDDVSQFVFPSGAREAASKANWHEQNWSVVGFPDGANFSVTGGELYLEQGSDLSTHIRKQDFTGEVVASTTLAHPEDSEDCFTVSFRILFFKGKLKEADSLDYQRIPREAYNSALNSYRLGVQESERRAKAWWFNNLYRPYFKLVRFLAMCVATPASYALQFFCWFIGKITPFDI